MKKMSHNNGTEEIDEAKEGDVVLPGAFLDTYTDKRRCGTGTYEFHGYIIASLCGEVKFSVKDEIKTVSVETPRTPGILPQAGDIVTAMVTVVNSRMVQCVIKCVKEHLLARSYRAIIKKEDIRDTERDRVDPYKCFRPGDIILARVMPITEVHWYHLTTAENELGVAIACAEDNPHADNMIPINWTEMQCPRTLVREPRKVARVLPENINLALMPKQEKED